VIFMTLVRCNLEKCIKCQWDEERNWFVCTADEIELDEDHFCVGGCDIGWEFPEEEEE